MSAATPVFVTAADFATDPAVVAARLGRSCQLPSAGVRIPVRADAGATSSGSQTRSAAPPHCTRAPEIGAGPSQSIPRPSKRSRQDLLGRCFLVRWGDVCDLWPQWEYCNRNRIPWRVLAYDSSTDRFQCQYRGASASNRTLIGNGGVREFALDHRLCVRYRLYGCVCIQDPKQIVLVHRRLLLRIPTAVLRRLHHTSCSTWHLLI
jgi:hypothetical protein